MRKDTLKDKDIHELVRLCGASILYLPSEYATGSLSVPTCFRATAQFLAQYGKHSLDKMLYPPLTTIKGPRREAFSEYLDPIALLLPYTTIIAPRTSTG